MSNHHSQKSINLHHSQVTDGIARRRQRQGERMSSYMERWAGYRRYFNIVDAFTVVCFGYVMIASALYLGYIL